MNGRVEARIALSDQHQPFVPRQAGTEGETTQLRKERVTIPDLQISLFLF
jgi:hypothetical protein